MNYLRTKIGVVSTQVISQYVKENNVRIELFRLLGFSAVQGGSCTEILDI